MNPERIDLESIVRQRLDFGPALEALERIVAAAKNGELAITAYITDVEQGASRGSVRMWVEVAE